jgi:polyribonucleotide nucleotidyltransferase
VEIMPGVDGLLHVSEIAHYRVKDVRDELKEGEQVMVKVINIDPSGKIRLSRKALLEPQEAQTPPEGGRPRGEGEGQRGDRGPRRDGRREGGPYRGERREGPRSEGRPEPAEKS